MKINYFYGSVAVTPKDGYSENLEFCVNKESDKLEFRYPYGNVSPEQADAVSQFVKTITNAYNKLSSQIDNVNKDLRLEEYAPKVLEDTIPEVSPVESEESTEESTEELVL